MFSYIYVATQICNDLNERLDTSLIFIQLLSFVVHMRIKVYAMYNTNFLCSFKVLFFFNLYSVFGTNLRGYKEMTCNLSCTVEF